jgi:hypothetical protein
MLGALLCVIGGCMLGGMYVHGIYELEVKYWRERLEYQRVRANAWRCQALAASEKDGVR